jgi:hypothetical protein
MKCSFFVSINKTLNLFSCYYSILPLAIQWLFCFTVHLMIQGSYNFPHHNTLAMDAPLPICCNYCHDEQLQCKACPHSKGSCHHCFLNGLVVACCCAIADAHGTSRLRLRLLSCYLLLAAVPWRLLILSAMVGCCF